MKKVCFIIPYFGKFNNYFQLFLNSCRYNHEFNWLVFTDDNSSYNYPSNVKVVYMEFSKLQNIFKNKFDFDICLERPYKLCDYKPTYGYIFQEYIKEYDYWGHCDVDVIFGNLKSVLESLLSHNYDKIFCLGHMTLYKNTNDNNQLFMKELNGKSYKKIFQSDKILNFDEEWTDFNINRIFKAYGKSVYEEDLSLNVAVAFNKFRNCKYVGLSKAPNNWGFEIEDYKEAVYIWSKGDLYRIYRNNNELNREDFLYLHMQKRKMRLDKKVETLNIYKIVPDEFLPLEYNIVTNENFDSIKKRGFCFHTQRLFKERIIRKIKNILQYA